MAKATTTNTKKRSTRLITEPTEKTAVSIRWNEGVDTNNLKKGDIAYITGPLVWVNSQSPSRADDKGKRYYKASVLFSPKDKKALIDTCNGFNGEKIKTSNPKEMDDGTFMIQVNAKQNSSFLRNGETIEVDPIPVFTMHGKKALVGNQEVGNGSYGTLKVSVYPYNHKEGRGISFNLIAIAVEELLVFERGGGADAAAGFDFADGEDDFEPAPISSGANAQGGGDDEGDDGPFGNDDVPF